MHSLDLHVCWRGRSWWEAVWSTLMLRWVFYFTLKYTFNSPPVQQKGFLSVTISKSPKKMYIGALYITINLWRWMHNTCTHTCYNFSKRCLDILPLTDLKHSSYWKKQVRTWTVTYSLSSCLIWDLAAQKITWWEHIFLNTKTRSSYATTWHQTGL